MTVEAEAAAVQPDYRALADLLLKEIMEFYADPDTEKEFQIYMTKKRRCEHA